MTKARGVTVLEVSMAMTIIAIALMALLTAILSSTTTIEANRQDAIVMTCVREHVAQLQAEAASSDAAFAAIYNAHNGEHFTIPGLTEGADFGGNISFYVNETASVPEAGLPRDLNKDGDAADTDASANYVLLPARIRVRWQTPKGGDTVTINGHTYQNVMTQDYYLVLTHYRF